MKRPSFPPVMPPAIVVVGVLAGVFAWALALVVLTASRRRENRWLAALLFVEGALQACANLSDAYGSAFEFAFAIILPSAFVFVWPVLRTLHTPSTRWLRRPWALPAIFALGAILVGLALYVASHGYFTDPASDEIETGKEWIVSLAFLGSVVALASSYIFSLVASLSAYRLAPAGSATRTRAKAFLAAFGVRDGGVGIFLVALIAVILLDLEDPTWLDFLPPLATIVYVGLLAYGILRTQLFDIDLKLKLGISRSTVGTIGLVVVLAAAKVAEFYLNKTYGFVAGGIAAGVMLFLVPRLNKIGDKVANAALPNTTGTAEYVANRKLEVYRAAVETAWEDGNLSHGDRAILDRLREKLEITGAEAFEVESSVVRSMRGKGGAGEAPA